MTAHDEHDFYMRTITISESDVVKMKRVLHALSSSVENSASGLQDEFKYVRGRVDELAEIVAVRQAFRKEG